jgi:nitroreductase
MLKNKNFSFAVRRARRAERNLLRSLCLLCSLVLVSSFGWFVTSCAQTGSTEQTRPRSVQTANTAATPAASANTATNNSNQMSDTNEEKRNGSGAVGFYTALESALKERGATLDCDRSDPVGKRILEDYGAIFVAASSVKPPPACIFKNETEAVKFQAEAKFKGAVIGGARIELQPAAMDALLAAREEARRAGLDITPRGGTEAARRSYADTVRLWDTRFLPALSYWMKKGRLTKEQVARLKSLELTDQVREVLELEKEGIYFSKDFSKSILYSIAAPGSSQHIMMLALDVEQFMNPRVREILYRHGWFQTVKSDLPHFTYLGLDESELPARGLRRVKSGSQLFWIPNVGGAD